MAKSKHTLSTIPYRMKLRANLSKLNHELLEITYEETKKAWENENNNKKKH